MPGVKGFSPINLRYMSKFFKLYAPLCEKVPQAAELFSDSLSDSNVPQAADDFKMLFLIPWDHHRRIIDKCKDDMDKALFFVRKTWENNWGRDALLNWLIPTFMSVTAKPSQTSNPRSLLCRVT